MQKVKRLLCLWLAEELNENNWCYYAVVAFVVIGGFLTQSLKGLFAITLTGALLNLSCYAFLTVIGRQMCLSRVTYDTLWNRLEANATTAAILIVGLIVGTIVLFFN